MNVRENQIVQRIAEALALDSRKIEDALVWDRPAKAEEEEWREGGVEAVAVFTHRLGKEASLELYARVRKGRAELIPTGTLYLGRDDCHVRPYLPEEEDFFRGRLALLAHPGFRFRLALDEESLYTHERALRELGLEVLDPGPASPQEVERTAKEYRKLRKKAQNWKSLSTKRRQELLTLARRLDEQSPLARFPSVMGFVYEVYEASGLLEPTLKVGP